MRPRGRPDRRGDGLDRVLGPSFLGPDWRAWRAAGGRPSAYITLESLERSGLRLGLMQALPNYFVGLGLVMTFLGLIAGLWFASQGMRTADMIEARAALVHLLNSATFKFLTSVAGIAMSLVVSLAFRIAVQSLRGRLDLLCDRIEEAASAPPADARPPGSGRMAGRCWRSGSRNWSSRSTGSKRRSSSRRRHQRSQSAGRLREASACPIQPTNSPRMKAITPPWPI